MSAERKAMGGFMGFAIRIDVLGQGAIYAFSRMRAAAMLAFAAVNMVVGAVMEFETGMGDLTRILAINISTTEELAQTNAYLRTVILEMARDSVYGIGQITEAYSYAVRAGKSAAESTKLVADAMLLATAVGGELEEVVKVVNRLGNIWRVAGLPIVDIVDKIVASEAQFAMTTEELMSALNMAGAIAAEAGLTFEQTATMLGFMYDAGINASTAGSTLRRAIKNLLAPTNKTMNAVERLGISYSYLQTLPIAEQFELLASKLLAVTDTNERLNIAFDVFGVRASNIFPVLEQMGVEFDDMVTKLEESEGAAQRAADAYEQTLIGKLTMLGNLLKSVATSVGEFSLSLEGFTVVALGLGGAMYGLTSVFSFMASGMASSAPVWQLMIQQFVRLNSQFMKGASKGTMWAVVASRFNLGLKQGLKSLFDFNRGVKANIGIMFRSTTGIYRNIVARTWQKVTDFEYRKNLRKITYANIKAAISTGIKTAAIWIYNSSLTVMNVLLTIANALLSPMSLLMFAIGFAIMFILKQMKKGTQMGRFFKSIFTDLKAVFKSIWTAIKSIIKVFMILVKIVVAPIMLAIAIIMPIIKIILLIFRLVFTVIGAIAKKVGDFVKNIVDVVKKSQFMIDAFKFLKKIIEGIVKFFLAIINGLIWAINLFLPKAKELEYFTVEGIMSGEKEEPTAPGEEPPEDEHPTPDTGEDPGDVPVGSSRVPSGGRSGGNYNITVYITADMYELMETEKFAEYIGLMIMREIARQKGAGEL